MVQTDKEQGEQPTPQKGTGLVPSDPTALLRAGEAVSDLLVPSPGTCSWLMLLLNSPSLWVTRPWVVVDISPQQDVGGLSFADTVGLLSPGDLHLLCLSLLFSLT